MIISYIPKSGEHARITSEYFPFQGYRYKLALTDGTVIADDTSELALYRLAERYRLALVA